MNHLPEAIEMRMKSHGTGAFGGVYTYESVNVPDVLMEARQQGRGTAFQEVWRYRWLPDVAVPSYPALRTLANCLHDAEIAAEKAKWPQMPEPPKPRMGGSSSGCWLHTDVPATHTGWVQLSWHRYDGTTAMLCAACAAEAATDPTVILRASEARRVYCASLPPIGERLVAKP